MMYLVFSHRQVRGAVQNWSGRRQITPDMIEVNSIGVFNADTPEEACKAAATHTRSLGTFLAVEVVVWGVDMLQSNAKLLGEGELTASVPPGEVIDDD